MCLVALVVYILPLSYLIKFYCYIYKKVTATGGGYPHHRNYMGGGGGGGSPEKRDTEKGGLKALPALLAELTPYFCRRCRLWVYHS
jgi:hypothetical protein